jgi:hypothetical protein
MNQPVTLQEWEDYIASLSREDLWSQCRSANTMAFVRRIMAEGNSMGFVERILQLFVARMLAEDVKVPEGGAFDLHQV